MNQRLKSCFAWLLLAATIMVLSPALGQTQTGADLVVALPSDIVRLDPTLTTDVPSHIVEQQMFETLVRRDPVDYSLQPNLAEAWESIDDLTWEFRLRQDVTFHNGEPFNADAVKFSFESMLDPARNAPGAGVIYLIESVEAVDEFTVRFHTSEPFPMLPIFTAVLGFNGAVAMIPPGYITEFGWDNFQANPVGTGPFKFDEWSPGQFVRLLANENYWDGVVGPETLTFRFVPEAFTRVSALLRGDVDIIQNIPPDLFGRVESSGTARITSTSAAMIIPRWQFNVLEEGPFQDLRVRQAVNYAIDWPGIVEALLGDAADTLVVPPEPGAFGYNPNAQAYPLDRDRARELLAEAGYPNGFEFTMYTSDGRYMLDKALSEAIAAELDLVGIKATVVPQEWRIYVEAAANKELSDMFILGFGGPRFDADTLFDQFHSSRTYSTWMNNETDALLLSSRTEMDPVAREELIWAAQSLLVEEAAFCCGYIPKAVFGVRDPISWQASIGEHMVDLWRINPEELSDR